MIKKNRTLKRIYLVIAATSIIGILARYATGRAYWLLTVLPSLILYAWWVHRSGERQHIKEKRRSNREVLSLLAGAMCIAVVISTEGPIMLWGAIAASLIYLGYDCYTITRQ